MIQFDCIFFFFILIPVRPITRYVYSKHEFSIFSLQSKCFIHALIRRYTNVLQALKCTTTPENCSMQTVHRSIHRSYRSVQTVHRSVHRSYRSVQTVHRSVLRSNRSVQTVQRSVHCSNRSVTLPVKSWSANKPDFRQPLFERCA
jgi:hypothetical protein